MAPEPPDPRHRYRWHGFKAGMLDADGNVIVPHVACETPKQGTPEQVLDALLGLVQPLGAFDRISVGFPGVVRAGHVMTAPNLERRLARLSVRRRADRSSRQTGADAERRHGARPRCHRPLRSGMRRRTWHRVRLRVVRQRATDAASGTGASSDSQRQGLRSICRRRRAEVDRPQALEQTARSRAELRAESDRLRPLHIGGGNARHIRLELEQNIRIVPNEAGITGGVRLWDPQLDPAFRSG